MALAVPQGSRYIWPLLTAHSPTAAAHLARIDGPLGRALADAGALAARSRIARDLLVVYVRSLASLRSPLAAIAAGRAPTLNLRERTLLGAAVERAVTREGLTLEYADVLAISADALDAFAVALRSSTPPAARDPRKQRPQFLPPAAPGDLPDDLREGWTG